MGHSTLHSLTRNYVLQHSQVNFLIGKSSTLIASYLAVQKGKFLQTRKLTTLFTRHKLRCVIISNIQRISFRFQYHILSKHLISSQQYHMSTISHLVKQFNILPTISQHVNNFISCQIV